ncbi:uncharacterized protein [Dermacentor albipictus]|uniref:uncharacterized protein n=1 Tax=Dermacentor albipictus TaxID=60249 RepID=UPI0038FC663B
MALKGPTYCAPLANAVLTKIVRDCRFQQLKGKHKLIVASCLIQRFKLSCIPDSSTRDQATIKTELAAVTKQASTDMKSVERLDQHFPNYNTAVPSSISVEWLFAIANEMLTKKRVCLSDTNIEMQLSLDSRDFIKLFL